MDADEAGTAGDLAADDMEYERVVVLNPVSGDGEHAEEVRELAEKRDFTILETREEGDAIEFAEQAAENGASMVAAAGGDGTLNEVVRGIVSADALDSVTFGVIPTGTGNNFAGNIGVTGIEHAFDVLENGERRRIDLGTANGREFINSCVGGLTADASVETNSEQKERLGVLAYVVNTLQLMTDFDGVPLTVETSKDGEVSWSGDAVFVLVGNGRRFPAKGRTQANMEDGLLNVTIIEEMPAPNLVGEALLQRLFGKGSDNVTHLRTPTVDIDIKRDDPVQFSLDGEMGEWNELTLGVMPRALELPLGPDYEPIPGEETDSESGL
ncbi:diacylglycerol/lipid kinase family protein [Haladaptatus sp. DFWS20]|uniref:diacylglycerol/lipid kinase family protein n=1 Tax=Haladaptatus sp. DFWS20 TaxID=3403467 RepID=UPI003EB8B077